MAGKSLSVEEIVDILKEKEEFMKDIAGWVDNEMMGNTQYKHVIANIVYKLEQEFGMTNLSKCKKVAAELYPLAKKINLKEHYADGDFVQYVLNLMDDCDKQRKERRRENIEKTGYPGMMYSNYFETMYKWMNNPEHIQGVGSHYIDWEAREIRDFFKQFYRFHNEEALLDCIRYAIEEDEEAIHNKIKELAEENDDEETNKEEMHEHRIVKLTGKDIRQLVRESVRDYMRRNKRR